MNQTTTVGFRLNGCSVEIEVAPDMRVLDLLRDIFGLTGTKEGCGRGECGACTILLNGQPVNACLLLAGKLHGQDILTIEGLAAKGQLHPLQKAFLEVGAVQCGYCTPGMLLAAKSLLERIPHPNEDEIAEGLSGNMCRCTGYNKILHAVQRAAGDNP